MFIKLRSIFTKWFIMWFITLCFIVLLIGFDVRTYIYNIRAKSFSENNLLVSNEQNASKITSEECQGGKKQKIVFLKTHKCASSSLQNIFFRFGEKYKLNFVLPSGGHQLYGSNNKFSESLLGQKAIHLQYSILCLHARWDYQEMEKVMGEGEKTTYITMLRDPVDVFESQWEFYNHEKKYGMTIDEFAEGGNLIDRSVDKRIGKNQMLWDLGLDEIDDEEMVKRKIEDIDDKFDLVMILERFEESIILMKNELCWDYSDITSLKLNGRKSENSQLKESTRLLLKQLLKSDYMFYSHFLELFDKKLEGFGKEKMNDGLENLAKANAKISSECDIALTENKDLRGDARWWGPGLMGYKVDNEKEECKLMVMPEMSYVDRVRKIQTRRNEA